MVARGNKYFNNVSRPDSLGETKPNSFMAAKPQTLTTTGGNPVADNQNSITAGPRGPLLMQDYQLLEKLAHQNRERIPERVVHAKGSGAFGTLTITHDITKYTKAGRLLRRSARRPTASCASPPSPASAAPPTPNATSAASPSSSTPTKATGTWSATTPPSSSSATPTSSPISSTPRNAHPKTNLRSNTAMWDFWSLSPESLHQVTILLSDRGLPKSLRHVNGYGSHTYSFINAKNERFWVKFHFKTLQGIQFMTNAEAEAVVAKDRESSQRDLFEAIERGDFPKWRFRIQIMPEEDAETYRCNPFDLTKVWPHEDYPLIDVGILELNRNPENYFAEVEQSAFSPSNIVPGIGFSPDKMLQARIFSYADAHRYRIGTHYESLPVNRPQVPVRTLSRATARCASMPPAERMPTTSRTASAVPRRIRAFAEPPLKISGDADRYDHRDGNDDYTQPGNLFRLMTRDQQQRLFNNVAAAMAGVPEEIIQRQLVHFHKADPAYAAGVAKALGVKNKAAGK